MILPIYVYGQSALRKPTEEIGPDYEGLKELIDNMYETMYNASGVGLAAPSDCSWLTLTLWEMSTKNAKGSNVHSSIRKSRIKVRKPSAWKKDV